MGRMLLFKAANTGKPTGSVYGDGSPIETHDHHSLARVQGAPVEMDHKTLPLPDRPGQSVTYKHDFDLPGGEGDFPPIRIVRQADGLYYLNNGKQGYQCSTATGCREWLVRERYSRLKAPKRALAYKAPNP